MKNWAFGFAILSLAVATAGPALAECQPTHLELPEHFDHLRSGHAETGFSAALIGCRDDLEGLSPSEIERVSKELAARATKFGTALMASLAVRSERTRLVRGLNEALGRDAISDIFVFDFSMTEYRQKERGP